MLLCMYRKVVGGSSRSEFRDYLMWLEEQNSSPPPIPEMIHDLQNAFALGDEAIRVVLRLFWASTQNANDFQSMNFSSLLTGIEARDREILQLLAAGQPLQKWQLVQFEPMDMHGFLGQRRLVLSDWLLDTLLGNTSPGALLERFATRDTDSPVYLSAVQHRIIDRFALRLLPEALVLQLHGSTSGGQLDVARGLAESLQLELFVLPASALVESRVDVLQFALEWNRACRVRDALLVVDIGEDSLGESAAQHPVVKATRRFLEALEVGVVVLTRESFEGGRRDVPLEVPKPTTDEQRSLWMLMWQHYAPQWLQDIWFDADVQQFLCERREKFVGTFRFAAEHVALAVRGAAQPELDSVIESVEGDADDSPIDVVDWHSQLESWLDAVWVSARFVPQMRLRGLTKLMSVPSQASWDDLVLRGDDRAVLQNLLLHVRQQLVVNEDRGWWEKNGKGLAIISVFFGESGTGKTFATQLLGKELNLDVHVVDGAAVVSKYIGESEKNLSKIFDAADLGGCILLFDEGEGMFGKRGEVEGGNDRYANQGVSYILQRLEEFGGLAIITTNRVGDIDSAFKRRIRFMAEFRKPEADERLRLWQRVFPSQVRLDIPPEKYPVLAKLEVSGGSIRNIALNASVYAEADDGVVLMEHLERAARDELKKLGLSPVGRLDGWLD
jgi:ATPase family associated with various cellular activities (AAA)